MILGAAVLYSLGACEIKNVQFVPDPQTEDEFNTIEYQCCTKITWQQYTDRYPAIEKDVAMSYIRTKRNNLLQLTDWMMTYDLVQKLSNKEEWISYRQALRDFPATGFSIVWNCDGSLNMDIVSWPIKPKVLFV